MSLSHTLAIALHYPLAQQHQLLNNDQAYKIKDINWSVVEQHMRWQEQPGHHILTYDDPDYPWALRQMVHFPLALYLKGQRTCLRSSGLAIVGARKAGAEGLKTAYDMAAKCAPSINIISGLAYGIDQSAHKGALVSGTTIAVLAHGLDSLYPRAHQKLSEQIMAQGALVSHYPLGVDIQRHHFPQRNRIIAGLSRGVLVVEAEVKSGSMTTARYALEENREVMAVPGSIHNPYKAGCHQLIQQGAHCITSADDIHHALGLHKSQEKAQLSADHRQLLSLIACHDGVYTILYERGSWTSEQLLALLADLVWWGYIENLGGRYCLIEGTIA